MNFIKAKVDVLTEYNVTPSRVLSDGDGIDHFETVDPIWLMAKDDDRVTYWSVEALETYISFVLGDGEEDATS